MNWTKAPLREVAPSVPSNIKLAADKPVWLLTLDQIESNTGRVINKKMALPSEAGTSTNVFDENNVLYSKLRPYLNKVVCPNEPGIATSELIPLRPVDGVLERRYLAHYLRSRQFLNYVKVIVAGVKMPRVIMTKLWTHEIPLPPFSEQCKIADILDQATILKDKSVEASLRADQVQHAIFNELFGDPILNDRGWSMTTIGEASTEVRNGINPAKEDFGLGTPFVTVNNLYNGLIIDTQHLDRVQVPASLAAKYRLHRGDICIVRSSVKRRGVGMASMWDSDEEAVFGGFVIRIRPSSSVLPSFLCALLLHPSMRSRIVESAGTGTITNISQPSLLRIPMINPPMALQEKFDFRMQLLGSARRSNALRVDLIKSIFESLTHRAFSASLTKRWREHDSSHSEVRSLELSSRTEALKAGKRHAGHDMYNKAALAAYITYRCHSFDHPMGRVKLAKLFYLTQKRAEIQLTDAFAKRAAGPLDDDIHKFLNLAKRQQWIELGRAEGDLKPVKPGKEVTRACTQAQKLLGTAIKPVDDMLDRMKDWTYKALERWATVLEAALGLQEAGTEVSVNSVKAAVRSQSAWARKLDRTEFSDEHIGSTLAGLKKHGFLRDVV